ncbi:MAG: Mrp/NBP35 family ATP-binding protein [Rubrivivax sp.]
MSLSETSLAAALRSVIDPQTGRDFVSTKQLRNMKIDGGDVAFDIELGYPAESQVAGLRKSLIAAARSVPGVENVSVNIGWKIVAHAVQRGVPLLPRVKNVIAVASGKGGVGKSTTTANLALALAAEGARVGILDADIYGPSQPMMMGLSGRPESEDGKTMNPLTGHGVEVMSIGFLVNEDQAMIWRGPMATQALDQLLRQTNWGELDYLLVDMPPGTGDIALSLSQYLPRGEVYVVTTPLPAAQEVARLSAAMAEKVKLPVKGVIENMSWFTGDDGTRYEIFGAGGGEQLADDLRIILAWLTLLLMERAPWPL